jgi:hypothetical protein
MKAKLFFFFLLVCQLGADYEKKIIKAFTQLNAHGQGNVKAAQAMSLADKLTPNSIPALLQAMNRANPVGDNWIRGAIAKITVSSDAAAFPKTSVKAIIQNPENEGSTRRAAFEVLRQHQRGEAEALIPSFLHDREPSLRREAIQVILKDAETATPPARSIALFQKGLQHARDVDQIKQASQALKSRGQKVELITLLGFQTQWEMIGPFDNTNREGFNKVYDPEKNFTTNASYPGKNGQVSWSSFSTKDPLGLLDINLHYGKLKEVVAYARTSFYSAEFQKVQFRLGSKNAWKIWVNQALLFSRDEYHRGGTRVDQFILDGTLQKGENQILLKICQNEQTQPWTKNWEFCLRITDPAGKVIQEAASQ